MDAIGEGKAPDGDPIFRYDVFDCLTFVEEVLALTLPYDPLDAPQIRQRLRYGPDGGIDYDNRNHFMLQQWIPNGIASGILVDVTSDLGASVLMEKTVSKNTWMRWKSRSGSICLMNSSRLGSINSIFFPPMKPWQPFMTFRREP